MLRQVLLTAFARGCLAQAPPLNPENDGWDDFTNNLATDLAPFLVLFGEQVTQQFISESTQTYDYALLSIAPIGVITILVSVIRVCGNASLRAFIGRGKESTVQAEVDLCTSTGGDVCELYNGGVTRLFGRPKLLELIYKDGSIQSIDTLLQQYQITTTGDTLDSENVRRSTPNLGLNAGFQPCSPLRSWLLIIFGFGLQVAVLVFAGLATLHYKWPKEDQEVQPWPLYLMVVGTFLLSTGIYLAAYLIGESTGEITYRPGLQPNEKTPYIYWVQPGNQLLADQVFGSFVYAKPFEQYVRSWKRPGKRPLAVWITIAITVVGFGMQFFALRSLHASVTIAQILLSLLMSIVRSSLRTTRLRSHQNLVHQEQDIITGHELDFLAIRMAHDAAVMGSPPLDVVSDSSGLALAKGLHTQGLYLLQDSLLLSLNAVRLFLRNPGQHLMVKRNPPDSMAFDKGIFPLTHQCTNFTASLVTLEDGVNNAPFISEIIAARLQLADLTQNDRRDPHNLDDPKPHVLDDQMVIARRQAKQLSLALGQALSESLMLCNQGILEQVDQATHAWLRSQGRFFWKFKCAFTSSLSPCVPDDGQDLGNVIVDFDTRGDKWEVYNPNIVEAVLALSLWQLSREYQVVMVEREKEVAEMLPSRAAILGIDPYRVYEYSAWFPKSPDTPPLNLRTTKLNPGMRLWDNRESAPDRPDDAAPFSDISFSGSGRPPEFSYRNNLFFGWNQHMLLPIDHEDSQLLNGQPFGTSATLSGECQALIQDNCDADKDGDKVQIYFDLIDIPLVSVLVHELFGSFVASIMSFFMPISDPRVRRLPNTGQLCVSHPVVDRLANIFVQNELGSYEDALRCLLPAIQPKPRQIISIAYLWAQDVIRNGVWATQYVEMEDAVIWTFGLLTQVPTNSARASDGQVEWRAPVPDYFGSMAARYMTLWACEFFRRADLGNEVPPPLLPKAGMRRLENMWERSASRWWHLKDVSYEATVARYSDALKERYPTDLSLLEILQEQDYVLFLSTISTYQEWAKDKHNVIPRDDVWELIKEAVSQDIPEMIFPILSLAGVLMGDTDLRDDHGRTVLWHAAEAGAEASILMLVYAGASADIADNDGITPCTMAAISGVSLEVLENLVQATTAREHILNGHITGADEIRDCNIWLILDNAPDDTIGFIIPEASCHNMAIEITLKSERPEVARRLLSILDGPDIDWRDRLDIFYVFPDILRAIFALEPFACYKPTGTLYALQRAAEYLAWESVQILLHHGAMEVTKERTMAGCLSVLTKTGWAREKGWNPGIKQWRRDGWPRRERRIRDDGEWEFVDVCGKPDWFPDVDGDPRWEEEEEEEEEEEKVAEGKPWTGGDTMW